MTKTHQTKFVFYFWLIALTSVFVLIKEALTNSSAASAEFLNYSSLKLLELTVLIIISVTLICFAAFFHFATPFRERILSIFEGKKSIKSWGGYVSFSVLLGCIGILTIINPPILIYKNILFIQWLTFVAGLTCVIFFCSSQKLQQKTINIKLFSVIFIFISLILLVFLAIINQYPLDDYGQSTVSITWHQGLFVGWLIFTFEFLKIRRVLQFSESAWFSIFIIISLFLMAGLLWSDIPFLGSYNSVGPFTPGMEWFPHSDSVRFDSAAQTIFIGEGINYRHYVDNPLMVNYVALLHFFKGGLFSEVISLQVWIFALLPSLIFLAGKKIFGFSAGLGSAVLYIFRVINILQNTKNHGLSSPKILISEGILEPLLILLAIALLYWLGRKSNNTRILLVIGGLFSLTTLVRANVWFILPAIILSIFFLSPKLNWGKVSESLIVIIAVFVTLAPWMWRSERTLGTPFFMLYKFQHSIYEQRYQLSSSVDAEKPENILVNPIEKKDISNSTEIINKYFGLGINISENVINSFANSMLLLPINSQGIATQTGVLFPNQIIINWAALSPDSKLLLGFSSIWVIAFFSIGLSFSLTKNKGGVILLAVYFAYIIASAAALTRGSRYTQPVEWVFIILFAGGCSIFFKSCIRSIINISGDHTLSFNEIPDYPQSKNIPEKIQKEFLNTAIFIIFFISIFIVIPDFLGKPRYENFDKETLTKEMINSFGLSNNLMAFKEFETFISSPNSIINKGRIIYSLPLNGSKIYSTEFFAEKPYIKPEGFDMLALYIISSTGGEWVKINLLQQDWPKQSLVWKDILYLGCKQDKVVQGSKAIIYTEGETEFQIQSNPKVFCD